MPVAGPLMRTAAEFVSAFTSGILASLSLILAIDLAFILFLALGEIALTLTPGGQIELAILFWLALVLVLAAVVVVWCWGKPNDFGVASAATGSLNILPLALLDACILLTVVAVANQWHQTLTTPLLQVTDDLRTVHELNYARRLLNDLRPLVLPDSAGPVGDVDFAGFRQTG
jgi:hypothetical protein